MSISFKISSYLKQVGKFIGFNRKRKSLPKNCWDKPPALLVIKSIGPILKNYNGLDDLIVAYAPEDENQTYCYAYERVPDDSEYAATRRIVVTEQDALRGNIWVISPADPNESTIQYVPEVTTPITDPTIILIDPDKPFPWQNDTLVTSNDPVYCWKLNKMTVKKQYDIWWAGGSEFDFRIVYPILSGYAAVEGVRRVCFSRSDISDCREKQFDLMLNTNWRPQQITNALICTEGGSEFLCKGN